MHLNNLLKGKTEQKERNDKKLEQKQMDLKLKHKLQTRKSFLRR